MKTLHSILFFSVILFSINIKANNGVDIAHEEFQVMIDYQSQIDELEYDSVETRVVKFKRGKAILFTVFTGLLGGHRIYFGTHHRTPILYSITFGGLGILPIIDLVHIIFTKDLSRYEHKSQVIMWGK